MTVPVDRTIGVTYGVFDLFHPGHVHWLERCREHCSYLIVCLDGCPTVDRPWKNTPVYSIEERLKLLRACRYVDETMLYCSAKELYDFLRDNRNRIAYRFSEDYWQGRSYIGDDLSIPIKFFSRVGNYSTTSLRERITEIEIRRMKNAGD